jgi:hypothetical protein
MSPENFDVFFEVREHLSSYAVWEVQRKDNFRGGSLHTAETFRLKNLATGLFLA